MFCFLKYFDKHYQNIKVNYAVAYLYGWRYTQAEIQVLLLGGSQVLPDTVRLRSGNSILLNAKLFAKIEEWAPSPGGLSGQTVFLSDAEGAPVALAELAQGELRPFRVFNLQGTDDR